MVFLINQFEELLLVFLGSHRYFGLFEHIIAISDALNHLIEEILRSFVEHYSFQILAVYIETTYVFWHFQRLLRIVR